MPFWNLCAAWIGILLGFLTGSLHGLFFHREDWLGGYGSWQRRIIRLGHVSLFGLAFINLGFVFTSERLPAGAGLFWPSVLLLVGSVTMPAVCYLCAWKKPVRLFFFVPVLSLVAAAYLVLHALRLSGAR